MVFIRDNWCIFISQLDNREILTIFNLIGFKIQMFFGLSLESISIIKLDTANRAVFYFIQFFLELASKLS